MNPIVLPYRGNLQMTAKAVADCLAQTLPVSLLLIDNGSRESLFTPIVDHVGVECFHWHHDPSLPSLSATWNHALRWAWESGAEHALVVNNDVRLHAYTYEHLLGVQRSFGALFVTATGVTEAQFNEFSVQCQTGEQVEEAIWNVPGEDLFGGNPLPGPDFSCFLITKECHDLYPFDERYTPAFCEDLDYHRRLMLAGDGGRIFGTGLPYLHYGSQTIKRLDDEKRATLTRQIESGSRAYHLKKWGGPANGERFTEPFNPMSSRDGVTTAELFERVRNGQLALPAPPR